MTCYVNKYNCVLTNVNKTKVLLVMVVRHRSPTMPLFRATLRFWRLRWGFQCDCTAQHCEGAGAQKKDHTANGDDVIFCCYLLYITLLAPHVAQGSLPLL